MIRRSTILLSAASKRSSIPEVTPSTRRKNGITALALLGFVGSVYSFSLMKMKQTDELDAIIEQDKK